MCQIEKGIFVGEPKKVEEKVRCLSNVFGWFQKRCTVCQWFLKGRNLELMKRWIFCGCFGGMGQKVTEKVFKYLIAWRSPKKGRNEGWTSA